MAHSPDCSNGVRVNGARTARLAIALVALVATGILAASALATSSSEKSLGTLNHQLLAAVNRFRRAHGLVALHESSATPTRTMTTRPSGSVTSCSSGSLRRDIVVPFCRRWAGSKPQEE